MAPSRSGAAANYDVVVIGSGVGGYTAAIRARQLGLKTIGPAVSEFVGEACLAMEFYADSEDVARVCHPHPTRSEALRQAAMGVDGWMTQA